ncbi:cohesin complex subunit [Paecilomyces lecythidis]|uniref:Cohesin complex subunit n=1 Tax=Paecilomyces lecythidis TaxID=3004212 RepID=A0ABR3YEI3_9EURO
MEVESPNGLRSSSPASEPEQNGASSPPSNRRKSSRAIRKPELFSQASYNTSKRKRGSRRDSDDDDDDNDEDDGEEEEENASEESDEDEDEDDDADEEEIRERKKAARKAAAKRKSTTRGKGKSQTRAAKKPKIATNGTGKRLAIRSATNGKRPSRPLVKPNLSGPEEGLFGEIFVKGRPLDGVAADWLTQCQQENVSAMRDLVNFILRCTGTDLKVTNAEIEDIDNIHRRVLDLEEEYRAQDITEYPLISKAKEFRHFRSTLEEFSETFIRTLHHSSILYDDKPLTDHIFTWVAAISDSNLRPYRHTGTLVSLSMSSALCDIAHEVTSTISTSRKQLEAEKRKKTVNKGRITTIQKAIQEGEQKQETIDELLRDAFQFVYMNRYRDVEPKIRADCALALTRWMRSYREMFFEAQYFRYLGWTLSDTVAHTRAVVVAEVRKLFASRDNIPAMRAFTDRFRSRLVEMATQDADVGIRAHTVEVLDLIRDAGLLEPSDIDTVGRLVFDMEPRVRKAAGRFFVANVEDVFEAETEEVAEELNETFAEEDDEDEDDLETPKRSWIKYRCLVDILQAYDEQEAQGRAEKANIHSRGFLSGVPTDSRFVLATEAIYPHLKELAQWQSLAGYLLYDHSQIADEPDADDTAGSIKKLYKLEEGQEVILLEVLGAAVKLRILEIAQAESDRRGRKSKLQQEKIPEMQEEIAHDLAQIIPRLLNKFGAVPEAASAVLRLEHLVDLNKIQDLQKDATAYSSLLNDINKQFLTHSDHDVLAEAAVAFLHARTSDEMKEVMESKVQELWDDMIDTLAALSREKDVERGAALSRSTLTGLANTVARIANLASITDCTSILETPPSSRSKKQKGRSEAPFNTLIHLAKRGLSAHDADEDDEEEELSRLEKELVSNSIRTLLFYFMWKVQGLTAALNSGSAAFDTAFFEAIAKSREVFVATLTSIMRKRAGLDDLRFMATVTLLDLHVLFATLRQAGRADETLNLDEEIITQKQSLVHEIVPETQKLIFRIHSSAERDLASLTRQALEPAEDDDPLDSDDDINRPPVDPAEQVQVNDRLLATVLAEQRLCELTGKIVLAMVGHVIDSRQYKQRLLRNRTRLGHNYKEVLAFLDGGKQATVARGGQSTEKEADSGVNKNSDKVKSTERVVEEDDEEEPEDEVEEDDEDDLRNRKLVEDQEPEPDENDNEELSPPPDEDDVMGD